MRVVSGAALVLGLCAGLGAAQEAEEGPPKLWVESDVLHYDTINSGDGDDDISGDDVEIFRDLLQDNPQVTLVELNSTGGSIWASQEISDLVINAGLDTRVNGDCDSSCVTVFLAGTNRSMTRGSRLGFHQNYWNAGSIQRYYEREAEDAGWQTPWDFASWVYEDTQQEVYLHLNYMVSRGVDPAFAIQTIREPDDSMWRPYRPVLRAAGVLTE